MRYTLLLIFLSLSFLHAQKEYPEDAFRPPLDIPLLLSGTFGELRSNHFHSGIDIKTQQREGLPVIAVGDGYISRVKISPWGFGKAVYITHPNGYYTSVYAHLKEFAPDLQAYIKKLQYERETYELEIYPEPGELKVEKGEQIAFSGNTGSSGGPHLHFELRDASQRPLNPLIFGMRVKDTKLPTVLGVYGYPIGRDAQINHSDNRIQLNINEQEKGVFLADKILANGSIGFGIHSFDGQDFTSNKNGVYAVDVSINGTPYFSYNFEKFSFSETRYINAFIDYENYVKTKNRIQKCFIAPNNPLSIYRYKVNDGILKIKEGLSYQVTIIIKDFEGNESKIVIPVEGKKLAIVDKTEVEITERFLKANIDNNYEFENASVFFPANTFYENFYLKIEKNDSLLTIHEKNIPAHRNFTVQFNVENYSEEERRKLYIARINDNNDLIYSSTSKRGKIISTKTRNLGVYTLATDTLSPTVTPSNFKNNQWLEGFKSIKVRINDFESGIANFRATINGRWILMEYDPKKSTLVYNLNDIKFTEPEHNLKIIVTDNVGNSNVYKSVFYRKIKQ